MPAWSPDGSKIAFASNRDGNFEIYVMNADGSGQTRLTNDPAADYHPAWSPDGGKIAFHSSRNGNFDIYVMNPDGTGATSLANNPQVDQQPDWSPNGAKIAFRSERSSPGNMEIHIMNADGTGVTSLAPHPAFDIEPDWSPEGSRIAFASDRDAASPGAGGSGLDLYLMNAADGTGLTRLTSNMAIDNVPDWSPDGSRITFQTNRDGNLEIYVMNADGSGLTNITNHPGDDRLAAWRPVVTPPPPPDGDGDGVPDASDNCSVTNSDQTDTDGDGQGDACDEDDDNDGVPDTSDNCPLEAGTRDGCPEADGDGDGVPDASDNCPSVSNLNQADADGAGLGDACDPASLVLTPRSAVNPVGTSHTVTATVASVTGQPVQGVPVHFWVIRARKLAVSGQCVTATGGQCSFSYQGPSRPAADAIGAHVDTDNDNRIDRGEPVGAATKRWIDSGGGNDDD